MACYHPLKGYIIGVDPRTGKDKILIRSYSDDSLKLPFKEIPCGKCIGCRLEYSRQWANRLMLEMEYHEFAYFVTLTYSDDFLPRNPVTDVNGQVIGWSQSLRKSHLSKFMKHLRKHFGDGIRFYGAGEYGKKTLRPHYHLILFGLSLDDLKLYKRNRQGDSLYTSKSLERCWSNYVGVRSDGIKYYDKIGHVVVAPASWETCAYTARYVTKKMSGEFEEKFKELNMELPFSLCSRRPGIGHQWYVDHPDLFDYEYINLKTKTKGLKFRPPKYFERLYDIDEPVKSFERREKRREFAEGSKALILSDLSKDYLEYLNDKEFILSEKLNALDRSVV